MRLGLGLGLGQGRGWGSGAEDGIGGLGKGLGWGLQLCLGSRAPLGAEEWSPDPWS